MARPVGARAAIVALIQRIRGFFHQMSPAVVAREDRTVPLADAPSPSGLRSAAAVSTALLESLADRPDRAEDAYLSGLEVSRAHRDARTEARLHAAMAEIRALAGDLAGATEAFEAAESLAPREDPAAAMAIGMARATLADMTGAPEAAGLYGEVAVLAERQGARHLRAKAMLLAAALEPEQERRAGQLAAALVALARSGYRDVLAGRAALAEVLQEQLDTLEIGPALRAEVATALARPRTFVTAVAAPEPSSAPPVVIALLGTFELREGERIASAGSWRTTKAKEMLAFLAVARDRRAPRDTIAAALWPDADRSAAVSNFHYTLYSLRQGLAGRGLDASIGVARRSSVYVLEVRGEGGCDVDEFVAELAAARSRQSDGAERDAILGLRRALALHRGAFVEDLRGDWIDEAREGFERRYDSALAALASLELRAGEAEAAIRSARLLIARDPLDESSHRLLLEGLDESGQGAEALRHYRALEKSLRDELGVVPQAETVALEARIRAHLKATGDR